MLLLEPPTSHKTCYSLSRPPPDAMSLSSLLGKPLHKPSTFRFALMSATIVLRRTSYSGRVSSQAWAGVVCVRRWRIHETAVSCSITSCICGANLNQNNPSNRAQSEPTTLTCLTQTGKGCSSDWPVSRFCTCLVPLSALLRKRT